MRSPNEVAKSLEKFTDQLADMLSDRRECSLAKAKCSRSRRTVRSKKAVSWGMNRDAAGQQSEWVTDLGGCSQPFVVRS